MLKKVYDFKDYDKYMCLKISLEMWLIIVYLMRPFPVLISSFRGGRGGAKGVKGADGIKQILYPDDFTLVLGILATIPAILFMIAVMKRKPSAGAFFRGVWRNGALMLSMAAVMNIVIVFIPILTGVISKVHMTGWVQVAISIAIIFYLNTSKRVKDTFEDFPAVIDE